MNSKYLVGSHVSVEGGLTAALKRMVAVGGNACAFFVSVPATGRPIKMEKDELKRFKIYCACEHIDPRQQILVHSAFATNLASPKETIQEASREIVRRELDLCDQFNIGLLNFHPGSTLGKPPKDSTEVNRVGIERITSNMNWLIEQTRNVSLVIETMAGQGASIPRNFDEIRLLFEQINTSSRSGVCIDTCHLFSTGFDLANNYDQVLDEFEEKVGFKLVKALHLNDSMTPLFSLTDRHEHLGKGSIGIGLFQRIMRDSRFQGIPLVLETPDSLKHKDEIDLLWSFTSDL